MAGAAIAIDDAATADTILSVKQRVFAANPKLFVRRQRLVYSAGPRGMDALADDETLGGAGVARDGSAVMDVLVADLTAAEAAELGEKVWHFTGHHVDAIFIPYCFDGRHIICRGLIPIDSVSFFLRRIQRRLIFNVPLLSSTFVCADSLRAVAGRCKEGPRGRCNRADGRGRRPGTQR